MATTDGVGRQIIFAGLGVIDPDLGDRLSYGEKLVTLLRDRPRGDELFRQVKRAQRTIGQALASSFEAYDGLAVEEKHAAAEAVEGCLQGGNLTKSHLEEIDFDPQILYEELSAKNESLLEQRLVSEPGFEYGRRLLRESCEYLASFVRHLPEVKDQAILATLIRTNHIEQSLRLVVEDMLTRQRGSDTRHEVFLRQYARGVLNQHGYLQLFGLNVPPELRRQRIDVAYVTLSITLSDPNLLGSMEGKGYEPFGSRFRREGLAVDAAITSLNTIRSNARELAKANVGRIPAHLLDGLRILLVGAAGSGKSTISQWLMVLLVKGDSRRTPSVLRDCFPFLVKLRELAGRESLQLTTRDLLRVQGADPEDASDEWLEETLSRGDGLLIFDGLDELAGNDREHALQWIESLLQRYPKCHFIVTSRPDDVDGARFEASRFSRFDLSPMNWTTTIECIDSWFEAMAGLTTPQQQGVRNVLIDTLADDPSMRQLAETPLIASMMCAIYVHDEGGSASTRTELYDRVTDVLLHQREKYRSLGGVTLDNLHLADKRLILGGVAKKMYEASTSVMAITPKDMRYLGQALDESGQMTCLLEILDDILPTMPRVGDPPEQVADVLLGRSVLLNRITRHECQFLHRSFQEYFTAVWYADDISSLDVVELVKTDSGRSTTSFLAGRVQRATSGVLVQALCNAHDRAPESLKRSSAVLVAECLASTSSVNAPTFERALAITATIVPPRSPAEARDLSRHGGMALQWVNTWLDSAPSILEASIPSLIYLCRLLAGARAMQTLERLVADVPPAQECVEALIQAWVHFDHEEFANKILAPVLRRRPNFTIEWPGSVSEEEAFSFAGIESIRLRTFHGESFSRIQGVDSLKSLAVTSGSSLRSVEGIQRCANIKSLWIEKATELLDVSALGGLQLWNVSLLDVGKLEFAHGLGDLPLRTLTLSRASSMASWDFVQGLKHLRTLRVPGSRLATVECLRSLPELRILDLEGSKPSGLEVLDTLQLTSFRAPMNFAPGDCRVRQRLKWLSVRGKWSRTELARFCTHQDLRFLSIEELLDGLGREWENLEELNIECADEAYSFRDLSLPSGLRILRLASESLQDLHGLSELARLERLDLRGSARIGDLSDLMFLEGLQWLALDAMQFELFSALDWPGKSAIDVQGGEWWSIGHDVG
ncbi:hypothetical protein N865_00225 [Intrasporangium oryzae NRRL B-24470]|uniref:NACHT domain-containing protein n=1 Tax=Intrasporangium oryzae NRRL B-24470 TaxID=1386089 RepID=W9GBK5_9MICO|nr:NACHT domain-containing protein [Intrasporangium oryzae]EWT02208.1 hypothetical protein N865_00225 [Intrasporangium oryzae NRRL B-24470]